MEVIFIVNRNITTEDAKCFAHNRRLVSDVLKSIEDGFYARDISYLDETANPDGSLNFEKAEQFAETLVGGIKNSLSETQIKMYADFLCCAFIVMQRNLLPSYENIIALARNTRRYGQSGVNIRESGFEKDRLLPQFGLSGIANRVFAYYDFDKQYEEEYADSDPDYYDFCKRYGYGLRCVTAENDFVIDKENSNEIFAQNKGKWENAFADFLPQRTDLEGAYKEFISLFFGKRGEFKTSDIEMMIDKYLFEQGKSLFSANKIRLGNMLSDMRNLNSRVTNERKLLREGEEFEDYPYDNTASNQPLWELLSEQNKWVDNTAKYLKDMLGGLSVNFLELIVGETSEETEKRIQKLIAMIENAAKGKSFLNINSDKETVRCFLYCALWESVAIRGMKEFETYRCETFGDLLERANMTADYCRYSTSSRKLTFLGGTRADISGTKHDDEPHFEYDDEQNEKFDAVLFDKKKYISCAERIREIFREEGEAFSDKTDFTYNNHLFSFVELVNYAIGSFLYRSGLSAFSFGSSFDMITKSVRQIETVTTRLRSASLSNIYKSVTGDDN